MSDMPEYTSAAIDGIYRSSHLETALRDAIAASHRTGETVVISQGRVNLYEVSAHAERGKATIRLLNP